MRDLRSPESLLEKTESSEVVVSLPALSYVEGLAKILTSLSLDSLSVGDIKLTKTRPWPAKTKKPGVQTDALDPSTEEIASWSLSEPIPSQSALQKAIDGLSEPKRKAKVRLDTESV